MLGRCAFAKERRACQAKTGPANYLSGSALAKKTAAAAAAAAAKAADHEVVGELAGHGLSEAAGQTIKNDDKDNRKDK